MAVLKAFEQSKNEAPRHLTNTSATKVTLPFVEGQLRAPATKNWRYQAAVSSLRPNSSIIRSRIRNFWILPVTVMGKSSTNLT